MEIFGISFTRKSDKEKAPSFAPPVDDDGAAIIANVGGIRNTFIDLDGSAKTEAELVTKYRDMSIHPEIEAAITDICDEAIVTEDGEETVELVLDDIELPKGVKTRLIEEFKGVLKLLEFNTKAFDVFQRWYVDGRLYYHAMVNPQKMSEGIVELRYLDPRKIKKVKEVNRKRQNTPGDAPIWDQKPKEYYIYCDKGIYQRHVQSFTPEIVSQGVKILPDSIVFITSGLVDTNNKLVLGHLHPAIKPLNVLRSIEDAIVIYRISRAPERRVFYIDTGGLPPAKAEQYMRSIMTKHRNKLVYDATTGDIKDDRRFTTMLEDYWIPRREGHNTTEIDTLDAGQNLGELADVKYFQNRLYRSLKVPISRLDPEYMYDIGRATQISRDELKFAKFIDRLRLRFNYLFLDLLGKQCVLKGIMDADEWDEIKHQLKFKYLRDVVIAELKDGEVMGMRAELQSRIQPILGLYLSHDWARRNIWKQSDEDIEEQDKLIAEEAENPQFMMPDQNFGDGAGQPVVPGGSFDPMPKPGENVPGQGNGKPPKK